jgi:hypothetical protein
MRGGSFGFKDPVGDLESLLLSDEDNNDLVAFLRVHETKIQ